MQLFATVLADVCFWLHGEVVGQRSAAPVNPRHYLQDLFERRLRHRNEQKGGCWRTPTLGWSEFTCSYWGPPRARRLGLEENLAWKKYCEAWGLPFSDRTEVDDAINEQIPSMLRGMWDRSVDGSYAPSFYQDVQIRNGVVEFAKPNDLLSEAAAEGHPDAQ